MEYHERGSRETRGRVRSRGRNLKLGSALDIGNGKFCDTFVYGSLVTCRFNFKIRRLSVVRAMLLEIFWKVAGENMFQDTCALYANRIIAVLFRKVKLNGRKYSLRCLSALFYICRYTSRIFAVNFGKYTYERKKIFFRSCRIL